jgi:hypothetical protein
VIRGRRETVRPQSLLRGQISTQSGQPATAWSSAFKESRRDRNAPKPSQ